MPTPTSVHLDRFDQIEVVTTKSGRLAVWESGGTKGKHGQAILVCGKDGQRLRPFTIERHAKANGNHALLPIQDDKGEFNRIIKCKLQRFGSRMDIDYVIGIYEITQLEEVPVEVNNFKYIDPRLRALIPQCRQQRSGIPEHAVWIEEPTQNGKLQIGYRWQQPGDKKIAHLRLERRIYSDTEDWRDEISPQLVEACERGV
jgi:hypothetical protein